jgi:transposase-like protein
MNLVDVSKNLQTDEQCLDFIEKVRWPDGVIRCVRCGHDKVARVERRAESKNKRTRLYTCLEQTCKHQFSPTTGTIFHDSHLPLNKWFAAVALIVHAKKGMSAKQVQRHLGVNYRTAWYMGHRIRKCMEETGSPLLSGVVEMDETYIGGRHHGHKGALKAKDIVVGIRQRGGPLRFVHAKDAKGETLFAIANEKIGKSLDAIVTDDAGAYNVFRLSRFMRQHQTVNHSAGEYVRGDIYTNSIESAFSLLKRGIVGSFHQVSAKHLHRYLSEFEFRFNRRELPDLFEATVAQMARTKQMEYKQLVAE